MKTLLKLCAFSLSGILLLSACGNKDEKKVRVVADNYLNALYKESDAEKAKQFATPESASFLDMIKYVMDSAKNMENAKEEGKDLTITIDSVSVEGNGAAVNYTLTSKENETPTNDRLELKKVDGIWLVHQAKETPMQNGVENAEDDAILEEETLVEAPVEEAPKK